jgi:hypothetical protein
MQMYQISNARKPVRASRTSGYGVPSFDVPTFGAGAESLSSIVIPNVAAAHQQITVTADDSWLQSVRELSMNIAGLRSDIRDLISVLKPVVGDHAELRIRDIPREQAAAEIAALLQQSGELYPSDISERLGIEYEIVTAVLSKLKQDGKIDW